jgi:hypothetical protein
MQKIYGIALLLLMATACTRKSVTAPEFHVTADKSEYKVGDTVRFSFTGTADFITFYPGDSSHKYEYRDRFAAAGKPQLEFKSTLQNAKQDSTLRLMASTDFAGPYDSAAIYAAHWTDITSRAALSTGTSNTASGIIDLSDFINGGQPVYLSFKYVAATGATQPTWTIPAFSINNLVKDDESVMPVAPALADGGWAVVNMKGSAVKWAVSTSQLQVKGGNASAVPTENWVVSKGLSLNKAIADKGLPVKNISANKVSAYSYIYTKAGTYTATFAVSNTTTYDEERSVQELKVTINP